jgi:N,N'-diacetyllegionaminate synthase
MKKHSFKIGTYPIQEHGRVFVIAEAGVNHNQRLDLALQMVDEAAQAGADAIKFQTFKPEEVVVEDAPRAKYQIQNTKSKNSQRKLLEEVYMPENFYPPILKRCKKRGIMFLSTPHGGRNSVDFLEGLDVPAHKIPSGDMNNYLLLDYVSALKKPIILSTGVAYLDEVKDAIRRIKAKGNKRIVVLQCTTNYPCPLEDANLHAMETMMRKLDVSVGFSDHTEGDEAAIAATALGMALYEFHFTLDRRLPGPDHIASIEPDGMRKRIAAIRKTEKIMGSYLKEPPKGDVRESMRPLVFRSIVAAHDMKKGKVLTVHDIEAKRPGTGVLAKNYMKFIGKKLKKDVKRDYQLSFRDVE